MSCPDMLLKLYNDGLAVAAPPPGNPPDDGSGGGMHGGHGGMNSVSAAMNGEEGADSTMPMPSFKLDTCTHTGFSFTHCTDMADDTTCTQHTTTHAQWQWEMVDPADNSTNCYATICVPKADDGMGGGGHTHGHALRILMESGEHNHDDDEDQTREI